MASNSSGSSGSSGSGNSQRAKSVLQGLKTEAANAVNVQLKNGYNGELKASEAGSIGGEMVRRMIQYAKNNMSE